MNPQPRTKPSRRTFLQSTAAAAAAFSLPTIVPAHVLGLEGATPPSEKIGLGVIGIGPRCTYDLTAMLKLEDVRCLAIADVQAKRRDAGKLLVDTAYGNQDLVLYRDFRELLARKDIDAVLGRHGRPLARGGVDDRGRGGQRRLQRKTLRHHDGPLPRPGGNVPQAQPRVPGRHPAPQRAELPEGDRAGALRQARQAPHDARLGLLAGAR